MSPIIILPGYNTNVFTVCSMSPTPSATVTDIVVNPQCLFWRPGGTRLYVFEGSTSRVHQYPCSTPYDISTLGASEGSIVTGSNGSPRGIYFDNTGTILYETGEGQDRVASWDLTVAWDVVASSKLARPHFNLTASTNTMGLTFSADGTKLHTYDGNTEAVHQYPVSTPFDLATAGAREAVWATGLAFVQDLEWSADGTKIFLPDRGPDKVFQYPCSTAFDIATVGAVECEIDVSTGGSQSTGLVWDATGSKMHLVFYDTDDLVQYSL